MKLWPFSKKGKESAPISTELPPGVLLADESPSDNAAVAYPAMPTFQEAEQPIAAPTAQEASPDSSQVAEADFSLSAEMMTPPAIEGGLNTAEIHYAQPMPTVQPSVQDIHHNVPPNPASLPEPKPDMSALFEQNHLEMLSQPERQGEPILGTPEEQPHLADSFQHAANTAEAMFSVMSQNLEAPPVIGEQTVNSDSVPSGAESLSTPSAPFELAESNFLPPPDPNEHPSSCSNETAAFPNQPNFLEEDPAARNTQEQFSPENAIQADPLSPDFSLAPDSPPPETSESFYALGHIPDETAPNVFYNPDDQECVTDSNYYALDTFTPEMRETVDSVTDDLFFNPDEELSPSADYQDNAQSMTFFENNETLFETLSPHLEHSEPSNDANAPLDHCLPSESELSAYIEPPDGDLDSEFFDETSMEHPEKESLIGDMSEEDQASLGWEDPEDRFASDLDSYDLGHYSDPDEEPVCFSLDENEPPSETPLHHLDEEVPETGTCTLETPEEPMEFIVEDADDASDTSYLESTEMEEPPSEHEPPSRPKQFAQSPAKPKAETEPDSSNSLPRESQFNIQPKTRPTRSVTEALDSFEQQVILQDSRFLKKSLDNLVDRYFAQKAAEEGNW